MNVKYQRLSYIEKVIERSSIKRLSRIEEVEH